MVCLEVMQVLIMCPLFYTLIDNASKLNEEYDISIHFMLDVHAILKHALDRSPAYGSIKDVLESFKADQVIVHGIVSADGNQSRCFFFLLENT